MTLLGVIYKVAKDPRILRADSTGHFVGFVMWLLIWSCKQLVVYKLYLIVWFEKCFTALQEYFIYFQLSHLCVFLEIGYPSKYLSWLKISEINWNLKCHKNKINKKQKCVQLSQWAINLRKTSVDI